MAMIGALLGWEKGLEALLWTFVLGCVFQPDCFGLASWAGHDRVPRRAVGRDEVIAAALVHAAER